MYVSVCVWRGVIIMRIIIAITTITIYFTDPSGKLKLLKLKLVIVRDYL